jgi:hypothetical protein
MKRAFFPLALLLFLLTGACGSLQKAAAQDPQRCERDPKCQKRDRMNDCTTQCVDDPACMDRCRQFNQQTGAGGR